MVESLYNLILLIRTTTTNTTQCQKWKTLHNLNSIENKLLGKTLDIQKTMEYAQEGRQIGESVENVLLLTIIYVRVMVLAGVAVVDADAIIIAVVNLNELNYENSIFFLFRLQKVVNDKNVYAYISWNISNSAFFPRPENHKDDNIGG